MDNYVFAVGGRNAGAFLTTVLQGKQSEESQTAGLSFRGEYTYHPTLFFGVVKWDTTEG